MNMNLYQTSLAFLLCGAAMVHSQQMPIFTQYTSFQQNQCEGQPTIISSQLGGVCAIPSTPFSQCKPYQGVSTYASQGVMCSSTPLNLTGITKAYVAKFTWSSSNVCVGAPSSVEAILSDGACHQVPSADGLAATTYMTVDCAGGKPVFSVCKDINCANCVRSQYSGQCQGLDAGSSFQAKCISAPGLINNKNGFIDLYEGSAVENLPSILLVKSILIVLTFAFH